MEAVTKKLRLNEQRVYVLMALPAMILLLIIFVYPLLSIFWRSTFDPTFTLRHWERFFSSASYTNILVNTFRTAIITTLISLVLGYPVAYLMSRVSTGTRYLILIPVLIPYFTSFLVRTFAWVIMLGGSGFINGILLKLGLIDLPLRLVFNAFAVYVSMVQILLVFMILPLYGVMAGIDKNLMLAANNLGANPFQTFRKVLLPLSLPGIASGCLLVFILSLGFYVTPRLLGGPGETMISQLIENSTLRFGLEPGFSGVQALVLTAITLLFVLVFRRYLRFESLAGRGVR